MRSRTVVGRWAALALTGVVATGVVSGCQTLEDVAGGGCEGTVSQVDALTEYSVLDSRPRGAIVPEGFERVDAGCWADSGEVHLYADRTYVHPGPESEVIEHYRTAARREGWLGADETDTPGGGTSSLCFTRPSGDGPTTLDIYFLTDEILREEDTEPGPDFDTGVGYRVAISSSVDWTTIPGCGV
ncbi:hypothetical protein AB0D49_29270 [Streptomyces sp. NPDC048290]|uniref:hypothetical protein n=1 Tax=Streptomyces sp. NPDC048290 TaxID=3155811 RepID=UPI003448C86C